MNFPIQFIIGRQLALNQGATPKQATSDGLLSGIVRQPMGLVLSVLLARNQEKADAAAAGTAASGTLVPTLTAGLDNKTGNLHVTVGPPYGGLNTPTPTGTVTLQATAGQSNPPPPITLPLVPVPVSVSAGTSEQYFAWELFAALTVTVAYSGDTNFQPVTSKLVSVPATAQKKGSL